LWICGDDEQVIPNDFQDEDSEAIHRISKRVKLVNDNSSAFENSIGLQGSMSKKI
jgi:hypothetical protein